MTKSSPAATDHWAVSTRTQGGVLTAGAALPSIELALLGIPGGFTPAEIQSWLRDLGGVAIETSRTDERSRPIPQLLHHALTGLLFSQTELWSHTGQPLPCAAVFVHGPQGVAFGWVGRARVVLLVNGEPHEPQWVIVRDEAGQEAMSAALPADSHVLLTLEYWPTGEDNTQAPASLDAEWGQSFANLVNPSAVTPQPAPQPAVIVPAETPARRAGRPPHAAAPAGAPVSQGSAEPATVSGATSAATPSGAFAAPSPSGAFAGPATALPTMQPGLAPDPSIPLDEPDAAQVLPSTRHPSSGTFAMPLAPGLGAGSGDAGGEATHETPPVTEGTEAGHPVGRWLSKMVGFAKSVVPRVKSSGPGTAWTPPARPEYVEPRIEVPSFDDLEPGPRANEPAAIVVETSLPERVEPDVPATASAGTEPKPPLGKEPPTSSLEPSGAPAIEPRGLAAAGIDEILGRKRGIAPARVEGRAAGGSSTPSRSVPSEPTGASYPKLEVTPVAPSAPGGMQIEREPVGADTTFAIPRLPNLTAPRPSKVVVPTAADMLRRDAEAAAKRAAMAPPVATAPVAAAPVAPPVPAPPANATPEAATPVVPPAGAATPEPEPTIASVHVPEPPADFLEEFAASSDAVSAPAPDVDEEAEEATAAVPVAGPPPSAPAVPAAPEPARPAASEPAEPAPPAPAFSAPIITPFTPRVAPPAPASEPAEPILPRGVSIMMRRPNLPPHLPSVMRAAAVTAPSPTPPPAPAAPAEGTPVLRAPSVSEPVPVDEAEVPAMLRELPLPALGAEPEAGDVPDGVLVATPSTSVRSRSSRSWPTLEDEEPRSRPFWKNPWIVGGLVALFVGVGWIVGHSQAPDNDIHSTPMSRVLRSVGLGGARFTAVIDTDPPGAFIAVDGKPISRRTPSTIELAPGQHTITLSMPDLGEVQVPIKGSPGQSVKVNEALHGSLDVSALDTSLPVKMSLDGEPKGFLPVKVDKLPPGLHELQFSGPNMQPWGQTVNIGIRKNSKVRARPMMSPATGVLQVQASLNDEGGTAPLSGATVFVDGEARGQTPLTLELPRGPHSLRVVYRGETAPIQVIDLPGGNKRFASFQFGLDSDLPPLKLLGGYAQLGNRRSPLVEASLVGLDWRDVREGWLHVRNAEGIWRRYQATVGEGTTGAVLSVEFPTNVFDSQGRVLWYMSAATSQGDEFYTELQRSTR